MKKTDELYDAIVNGNATQAHATSASALGDGTVGQMRGSMSVRQLCLDLAAGGLSMPIGTDLVMNEEPDPAAVRSDGAALGRVIERAARRWGTPLAVPLMDLSLEKTDLLTMAGVGEAEAEAYHFSAPLPEEKLGELCAEQPGPLCSRSMARDEALAFIGTRADLVPVGMTIGPFSLTTRLLTDPITATALAGTGLDAAEADEVKLLWQCLNVAEAAVRRSVRRQIAEGARAVMICEPAACTAFLSPRQLRAGANLFERLVMEPNLRLKTEMEQSGCDLIFHDCGELTNAMVESFAQRLHPAVLSLGSSRRLWEDSRLTPPDVVLYGNLPTKSFYSDSAMPLSEVIRCTQELVAKMRNCGHPHILGSECDVLFVPEAQDSIRKKIEAMMATAREA